MRLLILIPTYNRAKAIRSWIDKNIEPICNIGIDLLICDSSIDNDTMLIVDSAISNYPYSVFYESFESSIYEEKFFRAFSKYAYDYDYVWMCSDGYILDIEKTYPMIEKAFEQKADIINFDDFRTAGNMDSICTDSVEAFEKYFFRMNLYGASVVGKRVFPIITDRNLFSKYSGSGFAYQSLLMEFCAARDFLLVHYYMPDGFWYFNPNKAASEWGKKGVWQWSINWCQTIEKYPKIYYRSKEKVIRSTNAFSLKGIMRIKLFGGLDIKEVRKYKRYIKRVSIISYYLFFVVYVIPIKWLTRVKSLYRNTIQKRRNEEHKI